MLDGVFVVHGGVIVRAVAHSLWGGGGGEGEGEGWVGFYSSPFFLSFLSISLPGTPAPGLSAQ